MTSIAFTVAEDKCIQCDACVKDCPVKIIQRSDSIPTIPAASEDTCIRCQHCLAVCPTAAVSIFGLKPENSLPLTPGVLSSYEQMKVYGRYVLVVEDIVDTGRSFARLLDTFKRSVYGKPAFAPFSTNPKRGSLTCRSITSASRFR